MPFTEQELMEIGSRFTTQRLIEQGAVSVAVAKAHAGELAKKFPPGRTAELEALLSEIQAKFATQAGAKDAYGTGNVPVTNKIREAKKWIAEVITSADNAYEEEPELRDEFHKGGKIGISVPKITGRLQVLLSLAEGRQAELAEWGIDNADLKTGRRLLEELTAANIAQEAAVKNLPVATKDLYVLKGKAFLLLKRLARAGRDVFKNDPATAAKLNLDILRRKGRKQDEAGPAAASPPAN